MQKLPLDLYLDQNVVAISRNLLGKVLMTRLYCPLQNKSVTTGGIIVETEAYKAPEDKASHAYGNRRTARTETMFSAGGIAYVYLCYGMYDLFNVVTGPKDTPHAVLIRAIQPLIGEKHMLLRRNMLARKANFCAGPGTLTRSLGITREHNSTSLTGKQIWLEDHKIKIAKPEILATPRIGIAYAEDYVEKPWRFVWTAPRAAQDAIS